MLSYLIKGLSLGLYAGVLPGPTQAFILSKTIVNGWRRSLPLALVPLVSDLPIALLFCLLFSTLPRNLITIIQIIGGVYLVILGNQTWKMSNSQEKKNDDIERQTGFWQTVGVNLGNPNVYVFWGTIGAPIVLTGWTEKPISGLAFILGMYSVLVLVTAGTILIFGLTGKLPSTEKKMVMKILAIGVIGFGIFQSVTGFLNVLNL